MKRTRPSRCSRAGPTKISAHILNTMSQMPRPPVRPVAGARNADVMSRYHSPAATPCAGPPAENEAYPSISRWLTMLGRTQVPANTATLIATSAHVTTRPATERGPGGPGAARTLTHALHALLAHRGRAHAVGARGPSAPDAGDVGFPAGVAVTGGDLGRSFPRLVRSGVAGRAHGPVRSATGGVAALHGDRLDDDILHRPVLAGRLHAADRVHHVGALDDLAEDGVLAVEPGRGPDRDEELRAVGAGAGVRHG